MVDFNKLAKHLRGLGEGSMEIIVKNYAYGWHNS